MKGYNSGRTTEQKHEHEIGRSAAKRSFLEHPAVSVGENHVEQKVEAKRAKIEEWSE